MRDLRSHCTVFTRWSLKLKMEQRGTSRIVRRVSRLFQTDGQVCGPRLSAKRAHGFLGPAGKPGLLFWHRFIHVGGLCSPWHEGLYPSRYNVRHLRFCLYEGLCPSRYHVRHLLFCPCLEAVVWAAALKPRSTVVSRLRRWLTRWAPSAHVRDLPRHGPDTSTVLRLRLRFICQLRKSLTIYKSLAFSRLGAFCTLEAGTRQCTCGALLTGPRLASRSSRW